MLKTAITIIMIAGKLILDIEIDKSKGKETDYCN
jgi:hypothetical protein